MEIPHFNRENDASDFEFVFVLNTGADSLKLSRQHACWVCVRWGLLGHMLSLWFQEGTYG